MTTNVYPGVGKTEIELARITELASLPAAASLPCFRGRRGLIHVTTRAEVESMDLGRLICSFGLNVNLERVQHLLGRTSFTIAGYEHDARELFEIAEVRRFYGEAFRRCPALVPAADLRNECLRAAICCALPNLNVVHRLDTEIRQVQVAPRELELFFVGQLPAQAALHKKLNWSRTRGVKLLKRFRAYLGLPQS